MDPDTTAETQHPSVNRPWLFKPGQSGNPGGRPISVKDYVDKRTRHGRSEIDTLYRISHDPKAGAASRIAAACHLLDRLFGKPQQAVEVSGPDGGPVELRALIAHMAATLSEAQVDALIAAKDTALVAMTNPQITQMPQIEAAPERHAEAPGQITEADETVMEVVGNATGMVTS